MRLDWVHAQPCIACTLNRFVSQATGMRVEAHHLVDKGYRKHSGGHQATIPLCAWHHRGEPHIDFGIKEMGYLYGPSISVSKGMFVAQYGTERELLAKVDARRNAEACATAS